MATPYIRAHHLIQMAHEEDPKTITLPYSTDPIPYEQHYASKCLEYLEKRLPPPHSEALLLAVQGQHFRRWEVPRNSYPMTRVGYHAWRTFLKKRQAEQVEQICLDSGYDKAFAERVGSLIRKEGLGKKMTNGDGNGGEQAEDSEVQVLEDVACLVFLEDQFEEWEKQAGLEEEKVLGILRRTWAKMSGKGHELALQIQLGERGKTLIGKALAD